MRILELCLSPDFGGLEMAMRDLSLWLAARSDVELHLAVCRDTRLAASLSHVDAASLEFPNRRAKLPISRAWKLAHYIDAHHIDLVHLHWKSDLPLVALAKRLCRRHVRIVHTRHMNLPGKKHDPYHAWLYGSLDQLIVVTRYLRDQAERHLPMDAGRIRVIYNGVAPAAPVTPEQTRRRAAAIGMGDGFHIGLFGRVSEYKGQHLLIEAIRQMHCHGKPAHGWIIGEPFEQQYLERLRTQADQSGLRQYIHFVGFQQQPLELMPAFDVITLTTRNETFGLVLIEAMRSGVAVVGSDEGGVPEIIDHGQTGLLFETWNATSLAAQLARLYDDDELRSELAAAGHRKALHAFDRDRQFQMVLDCLRVVASEPDTASGSVPQPAIIAAPQLNGTRSHRRAS